MPGALPFFAYFAKRMGILPRKQSIRPEAAPLLAVFKGEYHKSKALGFLARD